MDDVDTDVDGIDKGNEEEEEEEEVLMELTRVTKKKQC
jgi:hypothetical protein